MKKGDFFQSPKEQPKKKSFIDKLKKVFGYE